MSARKLLTALVLVLAACDSKPAPRTVELEIHGMHCQSCVEGITHAVTQLEGVAACEVDLEGERARVTFAPDVIEVASIEAAIDRLGYEATPLPASRVGR